MIRHDGHTILLNGHESEEIASLKTTALSFDPGQHELSKNADEKNPPARCKATHITIADGSALIFYVLTKE